MVTINSNYAAGFAANAAKQTQSDLNSAMEKLSTGKRINFAKDDCLSKFIKISIILSGLWIIQLVQELAPEINIILNNSKN